jgi:tRNA pseudouridine38-40 synthase
VTVAARSFLHHQVRNIVGTLKMIGEHKWPVDQMDSILDAKSRSAAGPTAPADGVYLIKVDY